MSDARTKDVPPALYEHCVRAYNALMQEAVYVAVADEVNGGKKQIVVWEGMFTAFITTQLNLSTPYFTSIRRELIRMGCIRQLRRGGGSSQSLWELLRTPTLELFNHERPKRTQAIAQDRFTGLQSQITALEGRIARLEQALRGIIEEQENEDG